MTFQQLLYVVEISRCGSINKAAQKLFLSQSSISSSIKDLEEELHIVMFQRSNRGVEFTQEGKEFLGYANTLLEQKQHIESIYTGNNEAAPVYFSVSTQRYPFTEDAFIRLVKMTTRSRYNFCIKEAGMDTVIDDVYDHHSDLGVIFLSNLTEKIIRRILDAKNIEFNEVKSIQPCVFVRRDHPLAAKRTLTPEDLTGYPYMTFEHDQGVALDFSEEIHLLSFKKPPKVIQVNDRATAVNVIANTDAITTGSGLLVEGLMDTRMISIPVEGSDDMRLGWIKPKNKRLSPEAQEFVTLLEQSITDAIRYTIHVRETVMGRAE